MYVHDRRGRGDSTDTQPYAIQREVEGLAALIAHAGGSAFVDGMSSGCPLALHAAAEGLVIAKLALFEPPIQGNETPTGESDFTRELAALVTAGRRREAVERQWLLLALQIGWFPRRTGKPLLSSRQRRRRRMSRGWREKLPTS